MKVQITFKDPDALQDCINDAVQDLEVEGITESELEAVREKRGEKIKDLCQRWFKWGEYLTVEIDTETETIAVVPNN